MHFCWVWITLCLSTSVTSQTQDDHISELVLDLTRRLSTIEQQYYDLKLQQQTDQTLISDLQSQQLIDRVRIADLQHQVLSSQGHVTSLELQLRVNKQRIAKLGIQHRADQLRLFDLEKEVRVNLHRTDDLEKQQLQSVNHSNSIDIDEPLTSKQERQLNGIRKERRSEVQEKISSITEIKRDLDKTFNCQVNDRPIRVSSDEGMVAFNAIMTQDLDGPTLHAELRFDKVVTNIGNAYSSHTGTFTCPKSGLYVFSWTIQIYRRYLFTDLVRNGDVIGTALTGDTDYSGNGSGLSVIHLEEGDDVWIRVGVHIDGVKIRTDYRVTTFSGFLVR